MRDDVVGTVPDPGIRSARTRTLVVVVVAVLVGLPLVLVLTGRDDGPGAPASGEPTPVAEWRAEAWRGVQVRVPADWAVGGSPQADGGSAGMVHCGGAMQRGADVAGVPYVGRPIGMTDTCRLIDPRHLPEPTAPYVWLGSPTEVGEVAWDNGYTSETVEVGGQRLSVATDDEALRAEILTSAEAVGTDAYGCPQTGRTLPQPVAGPEAPPERLAICVYDAIGLGGGLDWSGEVDASAAGEFVDSIAGVADRVDCRQRLNEQWAVLHADTGDATVSYVVDLGCGVIRLPRTAAGEEPVVRLRPENVAPWALPGVRAYVRGPYGNHPELAPYFRGVDG